MTHAQNPETDLPPDATAPSSGANDQAAPPPDAPQWQAAPPAEETDQPDDAARAAEYLKMLQRERADFANYRRRVDEERAQITRDATLGVIQRLLPLLDDFERALSHATPEQLASPWGQGVALVERNLRSLLTSYEVQAFDSRGAAFDPREHEAISHLPSDQVAEGHVLHVVRTGYKRGDRVIRPAQVVVASRSTS